VTEQEVEKTFVSLARFVEMQSALNVRLGNVLSEIAVRITALEKVIEDWEKRGS